MQTQVQYITNLAKQYQALSDNANALYLAVNKLELDTVKDIYSEYGDPDKRFQPVNLLRAEIARLLLAGETVDEKTVEEIKGRIRSKNIAGFGHLAASFLEELKNYEIGKRDMFTNWQKPWNIFHTFFFRANSNRDKETVQTYLDQISKDLLVKLDLPNYTFHWVDFQGASNFGSEYCWLALYPMTKNSHRDAYQFFVRLGAKIEAGRMAGHSVKERVSDIIKKVDSYEGIVACLSDVKKEIVRLNNEARNYFRLAPGSQAAEWQDFYNQKIAAIDFSSFSLGSLDQYSTIDQLKEKVGLPQESISNQTGNLWLFKNANIGDVIFASKGVNTCVGIGIIEGDYFYDDTVKGYNHRRKVNWITNKTYQYKADTLKSYKTLFRFDTFSPTLVWEFLLNEYLRLYPELKEIFEKHKLINSTSTGTANPDKDEPADEVELAPMSFWWLNANPNIWQISMFQEGQRQTYTTHNERGNKRRVYKYFEAVKPGDLMIGYESSPTKQIKAIYEITKGLHITQAGEEIEFQLVEKLEIPVHWNDLKNNPALQSCEVFNNNQGSLFKLTEAEFDVIRETIDNKNILIEISPSAQPYDYTKDEDKPFVSEEEFTQAVALLKRKKNIILQGPPGVGKTFIARKLAYEIMKEKRDTNIEMVQFHQSYSYEDFIQGLRPTLKGSFDLRDGIFYSFCQRALAHPEKPFFFIIDEINRGNLSKIFGELMMLIEPDKRDRKFAIKLTYSEDEDDRFYVPANMYIIGTMNTADRSLAIVDYALRRRFAFVNLHPVYTDAFRSFLKHKGISDEMVNHICSAVVKVNGKIKEDINLGDGYQIGHSYFCGYNSEEDERLWWNDVLQFEIRPLLEEIWFDDLSKVQETIKILER